MPRPVLVFLLSFGGFLLVLGLVSLAFALSEAFGIAGMTAACVVTFFIASVLVALMCYSDERRRER